MRPNILKPLLVLAGALCGLHAQAALLYDQNVTGNFIGGTAIQNGGFTVYNENNLQIALRARERYDLATDSPTMVFNSAGNGTYYQNAGEPAGFPASERARWNFDWSINTDPGAPITTPPGVGGFSAGAAVASIASYTYKIGIDYDPTAATNYLVFDLINAANPLVWDHSFGNNTTAEGAGVEATGANAAARQADYDYLKASNTLVQNSWNYDFFDGGSYPFNPNASGFYSIFLEVWDAAGATMLGRTEITVAVGIPEPGALALSGLALLGLYGASRRRKQG